jgi:alginate O-acetyltransferase complex protein AlgI
MTSVNAQQVVQPVAATGPTVDARVQRSKPDVRRYVMLIIPLALLLVTFKVYRLEQPAFFSLACLVFGGFAVSYWLPFRFKETFLVVLSLGGAYVLLSPLVASLLIAVGLSLFVIIRSRLEFRWRVLALLAVLCVCVIGRATGHLHLLDSFWPVFGAIFMFRMIVYMYDMKHQAGPASLKGYLSYFFLLPNYYFFLFPVVDHQTFQKGYFKRDIHTVAQQGVWWIFRGTTHLLLYRVIYQWQSRFSPPNVTVATAVVAKIVFSYLLYLRISGQFHVIAGMLCLFGYDMPETNRRYFLAHSINDFWRRANIYWKDFMVKIIYFPAYFKLRRKGALQAELLSTLLVIVATWFLHAYQFFWLKGQFRVTANDSLFWAILGTVMLANVWVENRNRRRLPRTGWRAGFQNALQIAATFSFIAILWSMWSANSVADWLYFLRTGTSF